MKVQKAETDLALKLLKFQQKHDLTSIEMLQILTQRQQTLLKYMLRAERHPDEPGKGADEE